MSGMGEVVGVKCGAFLDSCWRDMSFCVSLFVCLFSVNSKTNRSIFFKQHFSERGDFWLCFVFVSSRCDSWESRSNDKTALSIS
jgi:hypothetical protein